jgi:uncharacterized membrane protein (DUF2068 family)
LSASLRSIALLEAAKGGLVLLAGFGIAAFAHDKAQHLAEQLVAHLHLNPAKTVPHIFLDLMQETASIRLWMLAGGAAMYALVRFLEAYGLWYGRRWAQQFAAVSGGIYIPFEIAELYATRSGLAVAALLLNIAIVALMLRELRQRRPARTRD